MDDSCMDISGEEVSNMSICSGKEDSYDSGWKRALAKYSPSKMVNLSPVKPIFAHTHCKTKAYFGNDKYLEAFLMAVMLAEENHLINTIQLINNFKSDTTVLNKMIRSFRTEVNWSKRLEQIVKVGQGKFGTVYRAKDKVTGEFFAVKNIKPTNQKTEYHLESLINIFKERNILLLAGNFPFLVNLYGAQKDANGSSFWVFMEYCPTDANELFKKLDLVREKMGRKLFFKGEDIVGTIEETFKKIIEMSYIALIMIYMLELLCAIDFLADRHLVHCDIKAANTLVTYRGHIKLSDYGEAKRYQWIDEESRIFFVEDLEAGHPKNKFQPVGNDGSVDPESTLRHLKDVDYDSYLEAIEKHNLQEFDQNPESGKQNFLTDIYGVGTAIIEWLYGGFNPLLIPFYDRKFLNLFPDFIQIESEFPKLGILYNDDAFEACISGPLGKVRAKYRNCMEFVVDMVRPRNCRAKNFLRDIKVFSFNKVIIEKAIDIEKVEAIDFFKRSKITKSNVTSIRISKILREAAKGIAGEKNEESCIGGEIKEKEKALPTAGFSYNKY